MSFGFGAGDFLALATLTLKLYKSFKDAPGEFAEISRELQSFYIVVADLTDQVEDPSSTLNRADNARKLSNLRDNLLGTMEELQNLYERYQRMGRVSWSRFQIGQEDLAAMRSKLNVQISVVNSFVESLNMAALGRMEPMLERIFLLLIEQTRGSADEAQTVLSAKEEDDVSWKRLELNLWTQGIPFEYVRENKEQIRGVLSSVVETNNLGGTDDGELLSGMTEVNIRRVSDGEVLDNVNEMNNHEGIDDRTIYAADSISQVGLMPENKKRNSTASVMTMQSSNRGRQLRSFSQSISQKLGIRPSLSPSKAILPYDEWVKKLSSDENAARIKLENRGLHFEDREKQRLSSSSFSKKQSETESTIISWAASNGEEMALELLLERDCDPSTKKNGVPVVILAAQAQHWGIVRLLVDHGADVNVGYNKKGILNSGSYPGLLHLAVEASQYDLIGLLLDKNAKVDVRSNNSEWLPLHVAARRYDYEAMKILLRKGADGKIKTKEGYNVLMVFLDRRTEDYLATFAPSERQDVFKSLEQKGLDIIRLLINNQTDLNQQDRYGRAALHLGIRRKAAKSWVKLLLDAGADANIKDANDTMPLHLACEIQDLEVVSLLLSKGAEVNAIKYNRVSKEKRAPLHIAASYGSTSMAKMLMESEADVNITDDHDTTPLHLACEVQDLELVSLLLNKGAKVNAMGYSRFPRDYRAPLHIAASNGSMIIAKILKDSGADVSLRSFYYDTRAFTPNTPGEIAWMNKNREIAELLGHKEE